MQVGIVAQRGNLRAASLALRLCETLQDPGDVSVAVDETTAAELESDSRWDEGEQEPPFRAVPTAEMSASDLVVSIGGDGTFLYAVRGAGSTPIMGVNLGEVGFLNAVAPEDAVETVTREVRHLRENGEVRTRDLPRIGASGEDWAVSPALNEVVVQGPQRGHGGGADFEIRVDGDLYTSGHADGVLVATPTGSSAYNLSEGGPLVTPSLDALVVTEMCADESMPPLVVDGDTEVTVRISGAESAVVVSDGRIREPISPPTQVRLGRAGDPVRVAGPPLDFFAGLSKIG